jgi:hypothetical protein
MNLFDLGALNFVLCLRFVVDVADDENPKYKVQNTKFALKSYG